MSTVTRRRPLAMYVLSALVPAAAAALMRCPPASGAATAAPAAEVAPPTHSPHAFDGPYPRLFVTEGEKAELKRQVAEVEFKRKLFGSMVESLRPYVDRHQTDPQWILSRIPLNREPGKRYVGYVYHKQKGATPASMEGYGDSPVPTIRFQNETRLLPTSEKVEAAPLEDVTPNATDTFTVLETDPTTGKKALKQVGEPVASLTFRVTLEKIEEMARQSAYLYWLTGDEKYARFSADILLTLADAAANMNHPLTDPDGFLPAAASYRYPFGNVFTNMSLCIALAQGMDYLHGYFVQQHADLLNYEKGMKTLAAYMGPVSNPHNISVNENLTKIELALSMGGDQAWSAPYLATALDGVTAQARAIDKNGVWIEPCAYSDYTVAWFMKILWIGYNNHLDLLDRIPQVLKCGSSQLRDLFPNGIYMGDGDNWSPHPRVWVIEPALTLAQRTGNVELEKKLSQYVNLMLDNGIYTWRGEGPDPIDSINVFAPELKYPSSGSLPLAASVRNDTRESLAVRNIPPLPPLGDGSKDALARRNQYQAEHSLQATMYGTMLSHQHQQGITLDLYGCGNALGLDPGPGEDAYAGPIHTGFSTRWAAHNTVVIDGASTGCPHMTNGVMEPEDGVAPVSASFSFVKGENVDPNSKKDQRRLVIVARTSPTSGYYVDVYHSAGERKNEYLYHNVGLHIDVLDKGEPVAPREAPGELNDDANRDAKALVGYRFFTDKQTYAVGEDDVQIRFTAPYETEAEPVHMSMFLPGGPGRTLVSAMTPALAAHRAYGGYVDKPIPTVIVRQQGEAWARPFVAVFEPYRGEHQSVKTVRRIAPAATDATFTGLSVESPAVPGVNGVIRDEYFTAIDPAARAQGAGWAFRGLCGAVRTADGKPVELYLGSGSELAYGGYRLSCANGRSAASLLLRGGEPPVLSSTGEMRVTLPLNANPGRNAPPAVKLLDHDREVAVTGVQVLENFPEEGKSAVTATFPATQSGTIKIEQ